LNAPTIVPPSNLIGGFDKKRKERKREKETEKRKEGRNDRLSIQLALHRWW